MTRLSFSVTVVLLLLLLGTTQSNASTSAKEEEKFNPRAAVVMILIVSIFFGLGCVSVYMRSCLAHALGINDRPSNPGNWLNVRETTSGLEETVIETFPTFCYSTVKTIRIGEEVLECPVCLNEFEDDETLRLIPQCFHVFHPACIDAWLRSNTTCPLCRSNLVPVLGESVSFEIPGLAREPCQNSPGTLIDDDNRRTVLGSPDYRLFDSVAWTGNQSMPRKSMSTGWKLNELFSHSSFVSQPGENLDRFTLRLPQEIQDQLMNQGLQDNVGLPQVRCSTRGYRTESLGTERNYFYFERFDKGGRLDRRPFSITPPYRTDSIRSSEGIYPEGSGPPKGLLLAIKSPIDRLFNGKNNVGEHSYLRSGDASHV